MQLNDLAGGAGGDVAVSNTVAGNLSAVRLVTDAQTIILDLRRETADPRVLAMRIQSGDWIRVPPRPRSRFRDEIQFRCSGVSLFTSMSRRGGCAIGRGPAAPPAARRHEVPSWRPVRSFRFSGMLYRWRTRGLLWPLSQAESTTVACRASARSQGTIVRGASRLDVTLTHLRLSTVDLSETELEPNHARAAAARATQSCCPRR